MPTNQDASRGSELADRLRQGIRDADSAPLPGARALPVLRGINAQGRCQRPFENVRVDVTNILIQSEKVFSFGGTVVMEIVEGEDYLRLVNLRTGGRVEIGAEDWLSNLFVCEDKGQQFPLPGALADVILRAEPTISQLPRIRTYAQRPIFDDDFRLRGPGWHSEVGILVHGRDIEPVLDQIPATGDSVLDRLPHYLRRLLAGFCFCDDADLVNAAGTLLTGLLANHFLTESKPLMLIDGNQPGVGKTLLCRSTGVVLGGRDPPLIHYTPDEEELQKRVCANIREGDLSVLLFDNAKTRGGGVVESPTIEANSMAPEISLRILGRSENYKRPNDLLWMLTMNSTRVSPDLVSRALPIRLAWEGDPRRRTFDGEEPIRFAREHRVEILGELAGMVVRWNQQGRPNGDYSHRCSHWARMIGGILDVAQLPGFLANYGDAAASFNQASDDLAALAEAAVLAGNGFVFEGISDSEE